MKNLLEEIIEELKELGLTLNDVIIIYHGEILKFKTYDDYKKLDIDYEESFGRCNIRDVQVVVDNTTWFERTSFDGAEGFDLRTNPLNGTYKEKYLETHYG